MRSGRVSGLESGTRYEVRVLAVNGVGESQPAGFCRMSRGTPAGISSRPVCGSMNAARRIGTTSAVVRRGALVRG